MTTGAPTRDDLLQAIDRMAGVSVLVVADLVLDEFEYGEIGRVSREAPVLILNHRRTDRVPGGGANTVNNIRALDGQPVVVGRVGEDEPGEHLLGLFRERGIETSGIWRDPAYATPVKRRILAGSAYSVKQQIVRIDRGGGPPVDAGGSPLLARVREGGARTRGTLISDYSFGVIHPGTIAQLSETIRASGRPFLVDSRSQRRAGTRMRESLQAETLVVTQGSQGMSIFARGAPPVHLPVYGTDEVADVTGAGDTVIGTLALAILSGCRYEAAALLANYAGGLVVMKRGTATVSRDELRQALRTDPAFERRLRPA